MPAFNPTSKGNKSIVRIASGVLTDPWDAEIDGYDVFRLQDIQVNQYNSLLLNVNFGSSSVVDSTMGDISLGVANGSQVVTATDEPLKFITGSLDWNLSPWTTNKRRFNFLWTNSDVNIEDMAPKFTNVESEYPEYRTTTETNKTAVLPYIPNFVDIFFRQQPQTNILQFIYTLYGINNIT